jgi:hypothetical protein
MMQLPSLLPDHVRLIARRAKSITERGMQSSAARHEVPVKSVFRNERLVEVIVQAAANKLAKC